MIQGQGWADVKVLKSGGFKVREVPSFDNIFRIVDSERTDLFPRAVIEPYSEVAQRSQLSNLVVDDKLKAENADLPLSYAAVCEPLFKNPEVAATLKKAFEASYQDGSFAS